MINNEDLCRTCLDSLGDVKSLPVAVAKFVLNLFTKVEIYNEDLFCLIHKTIHVPHSNARFFLDKNNGFTAVFEADKSFARSSWLCFLVSGSVEIERQAEAFKITSEDEFPYYYQTNCKEGKTRHNDAVIAYIPVGGAIDVNPCESQRALISAVKHGKFSFFDFVKISSVPNGIDFIRENFLAQRAKPDMQGYYLTEIVTSVAGDGAVIKAVAQRINLDESTISRLWAGNFRLGDYLRRLKVIRFEARDPNVPEIEIAAELGFSTIYKMRDFLKREKPVSASFEL